MITYLMVGIPGSGKSTTAKQLQAKYGGIICSADDYFTMKDGTYHYVPEQIRDAHESCRESFYIHTHKFQTIRERAYIYSSAIVDNTNVKFKDMSYYISESFKSGRKVIIVEPDSEWKYNVEECTKRNVHGVPSHIIQRMHESLMYTKSHVFPILEAIGVEFVVGVP
jgi:adenylate kinase family enzyme